MEVGFFGEKLNSWESRKSYLFLAPTNKLLMKITTTTLKALCALLFGFASYQVSAQGFYDGFESGTYTPTWVNTGGTYTRTVPATGSAVGTYNFQQTGTGTHLQGVRASFPQDQISEVSYYVKSSNTAVSGTYVIIGEAGMSVPSSCIAFMYFSSAGNMRFYTNTAEINQPVVANTWYHVELLNFNWTAKTFDVYLDGALLYTAFPFRDPAITSAAEIHLYNLTSTVTANYDEFNIVPSCVTPGATALSANANVYLDASGNATITGADVDGGSTVNCGTPVLSVNPSSFSCSDIGTPVPVTLYVEDSFGAIDSTTATVTILDTLSPTASNPATINVQCLSDVPMADTSEVTDAADNCSAQVAFVSEVSDGLTCPETITRTYSVADLSGNQILVEQLIVIQDTISPVPDSTALATINETCEVTPVAPTATDGCSGLITATPDQVFPITNVGTTTVTWTYEDICGNTATQTQDVVIGAIDASTSTSGITISANASGLMYQWIDCGNGQPVANATSQNFTASANGDYAVIVTDGACSDTSACVTINQVSLGELIDVPLTVYPNPSSGESIKVQTTATILKVQLVDLTGRSVDANFDFKTNQLNVDKLAPGNYSVTIHTAEHGAIVKKITISK